MEKVSSEQPIISVKSFIEQVKERRNKYKQESIDGKTENYNTLVKTIGYGPYEFETSQSRDAVEFIESLLLQRCEYITKRKIEFTSNFGVLDTTYADDGDIPNIYDVEPLKFPYWPNFGDIESEGSSRFIKKSVHNIRDAFCMKNPEVTCEFVEGGRTLTFEY